MTSAPSPRTTLRRHAERGSYGRDDVHAILDDGLIAHVGVTTPAGPIVLPMAYGRDDDHVYLHGAVANHMLGTGEGNEICVTVTLLDGLITARSAFHNSMNYRSVVIRGRATRVAGDEARLRALRLITDHVVTQWEHSRPPNESELKRTMVLALPLTEASVKTRTGDPIDDPEDLDGPWWAGVIPVTTVFGAPRPAADLRGDPPVPEPIRRLGGA